jgi:GNAT superfamily N-acetyltransferase
VSGVVVRELPVADTRPLRHAVLRPNEPLENLAAHELDGAFAVGAFEHDQLLAVGLIAEDGGLSAWRIRGMATAEHARGRGLGAAVLDALVHHH